MQHTVLLTEMMKHNTSLKQVTTEWEKWTNLETNPKLQILVFCDTKSISPQPHNVLFSMKVVALLVLEGGRGDV